MGSRFLTKAEAAKVLGCSVRTIFAKIARGELRPVANGPTVGVLEEDVIAMRDSKRRQEGERVLPFAINRQTLMRLHNEVSVLRHDMNQVLRVLNIRREPLKASNLEITSLYKTATTYADEGWPPQVEETWVNYLLRLTTHHFSQIEAATKDRHPWRPFLRLISTMVLRPYNTELSIQLVSARDSIQTAVAVWFEIKHLPPRQLDAMLSKDGRPSKRLLGVLERRQQKFAAKD